MSQIDFENINENFPIAGQDNDTQTFRDNFEAIKTGLRVASEEIEDLQDNTARTDQNTDYNGFEVNNAVLRKVANAAWDYGERSGSLEIDFENGHYQTVVLIGDSTFSFANFATAVDLENREFSESEGIASSVCIEVRSTGDSTPVSLDFTPSGSGASTFRKNFAQTLSVSEDPIILEVWRYSVSEIFIKLVDRFNNNTILADSIENFTDVEFENLEDGQLLSYDAAEAVWKNRTSDALDVSVSDPVTGDIVVYDSVDQEWKNQTSLVQYDVSIVDIGNANRFFIDGVRIEDAELSFRVGKTYRFNLTQSVLDLPTSVRFSTTPDTETPLTVTDFDDEVVVNTDQDYVEITITETTPKVLYLWGVETQFDTSKIGGETAIQVETPQIFLGSTELSPGIDVPVDLTKSASYFSTGDDSVTDSGILANGVEGQVKVLAMDQFGGDTKTIQVTNYAWNGAGVISFDQSGAACTLQFINGKWFCIGNNGGEFN